MIRHLIKKLRDYKITYIIYNFFHKRKLFHNRSLYRNLKIKKPLYWSVSSVDFAGLPEGRPWLDRPDAKEELLNNKVYQELPENTKVQLMQWVENGFIIIKNFLSAASADDVNKEIDKLLAQKKIQALANGKIMFAFKQSELLKSIITDKRIVDLMTFIFQQDIIPFQTINFIKGSQQRAHSDSIHMTTYPLGYLAAAWLALDDVDDENGSLFYYSGSHRLPYVLAPDLNTKKAVLQLDPQTHQHYEDKMEEVIQGNGLKKTDFHAQKGDLFIWHANLIHGGNIIKNDSRTRKSMVVHYFAKNVVKYHEISQRPALLDDKYM
jgi:ectoine hydroxylase